MASLDKSKPKQRAGKDGERCARVTEEREGAARTPCPANNHRGATRGRWPGLGRRRDARGPPYCILMLFFLCLTVCLSPPPPLARVPPRSSPVSSDGNPWRPRRGSNGGTQAHRGALPRRGCADPLQHGTGRGERRRAPTRRPLPPRPPRRWRPATVCGGHGKAAWHSPSWGAMAEGRQERGEGGAGPLGACPSGGRAPLPPRPTPQAAAYREVPQQAPRLAAAAAAGFRPQVRRLDGRRRRRLAARPPAGISPLPSAPVTLSPHPPPPPLPTAPAASAAAASTPPPAPPYGTQPRRYAAPRRAAPRRPRRRSRQSRRRRRGSGVAGTPARRGAPTHVNGDPTGPPETIVIIYHTDMARLR